MFVKILIIVGIAVLVWSASARSSQAHGAKQVVTVRPYDSLWSIATRLDPTGDPRPLIDHLEGELGGAPLESGMKLVIP